MKKAECIERYGEAEWKRRLEQGKGRKIGELEREKKRKTSLEWSLKNPEKAKRRDYEASHKGGKYYERMCEYQRTGLPGERNKIRDKHRHQYKPFKDIIAPDSQLHHEWVPKTTTYRGLALVEADKHMHGFIDVIRILDGEITLLTEEDVKNGERNKTLNSRILNYKHKQK